MLALVPAFLLGAVVAAYNLPALKVAQVQIAGSQKLDVAKIRAALHLEGKNMLTVDVSMVDRVMRQEPIVKSVNVRRQWPDKIIVQVEERRPVAFWQTPDGIYAVDQDGFVLTEAPGPGSLPAITSHDGGVRVGGRVPSGVLGLASDLTTRLPAAVGARPVEFEYSAARGLVVATDKDWNAVFGDERGTDSKLAVLAAVLQTADERELDFREIDLRFGERPFLR